MAERKPVPNAIPPNNKLPIYSVVLILIGSVWAVYEYNPYGMMRSLTEKEKKDKKEFEDDERLKARMAKLKASP